MDGGIHIMVTHLGFRALTHTPPYIIYIYGHVYTHESRPPVHEERDAYRACVAWSHRAGGQQEGQTDHGTDTHGIRQTTQREHHARHVYNIYNMYNVYIICI